MWHKVTAAGSYSAPLDSVLEKVENLKKVTADLLIAEATLGSAT